jgi:hypothetical protein
MSKPHAADDFVAIRARIEELRREREPAPPHDKAQPAVGRRSYPRTDRAGMLLVMHRMLQRGRI